MSFIKWFKKNFFDWSSEPPSRSTEHDPGWKPSRFAQEAAKRANKGALDDPPSSKNTHTVSHDKVI